MLNGADLQRAKERQKAVHMSPADDVKIRLGSRRDNGKGGRTSNGGEPEKDVVKISREGTKGVFFGESDPATRADQSRTLGRERRRANAGRDAGARTQGSRAKVCGKTRKAGAGEDEGTTLLEGPSTGAARTVNIAGSGRRTGSRRDMVCMRTGRQGESASGAHGGEEAESGPAGRPRT